MDKKKLHEQKILELVYPKNDNLIVETDKEQPDFWLKHKNSPKYFGVEITELFYSESTARLQKNTELYKGLIETEEHKHKDDIDTLKVEDDLKLYRDGELVTTLKAIITKPPSQEDFLTNINNRIIEKTQKYQNYSDKLTHINLIIHDCERRFALVDPEGFYYQFYSPAIKKSILNSDFREIFFITLIKDDRLVYYPLKMLLFVAQNYLFNAAFTEYYEEANDDIPDEIYFRSLCKYLRQYGFKNLKYEFGEHDFKLVYYNTGFSVSVNESININIYNNDLFMNKFKNVNGNIEDIIINKNLSDKLTMFDDANTFVIDMVFETGSKVKYN